MRKPELGAYVQKDSSTDTNWYVIPLCVKHSIKAELLEVADTTTFVSAHLGETCAKQRPIGNFWPHELWATMATNALKYGADLAKAQDWLDRATEASARYSAKRKERLLAPPPLKGMY